MVAKYMPRDYRPHKGVGGVPPKRTHAEMAEELGVPPATLKNLVRHHPDGYPQGIVHGYGSRSVYYVRKDFIKWWLSLPEDVRQKAKSKD